MSYIDEINRFNIILVEHQLSTNAQALWYRLMSINNSFGWKESFSVSNSRLEAELHLSRQALNRARQALVAAGCLTYLKGTKNRTGVYRLNALKSDSLAGEKQTPRTEAGQKPDTERTESGHSVTALNRLDKDIDKEKNKRYIGQSQAIAPIAKTDTEKDFALFWSYYPRKVAKKQARKAFDRLIKKDKVNAGDIVDGALAYADWCEKNSQEPQYIKHPATWLNGGCWTDELMDKQYLTPWEKERKASDQREKQAFSNVAAMMNSPYAGLLEE